MRRWFDSNYEKINYRETLKREREAVRVVIREQVVITAGAKKHVHNTLSACSNTMATAHYCFIN
jgi:hypothetical protein